MASTYTFPFSNLSDNNLLELYNYDHQFPLSVIDTLQYNPFSESSQTDSVDNFLTTNLVKDLSCDYYLRQDVMFSLCWFVCLSVFLSVCLFVCMFARFVKKVLNADR